MINFYINMKAWESSAAYSKYHHDEFQGCDGFVFDSVTIEFDFNNYRNRDAHQKWHRNEDYSGE